MNTARRQLCFMVSALCAAGSIGSAVEGLFERSSSSTAVDRNDVPIPANQRLMQLGGGAHEIASQLTLVAGFTELAQEKIKAGELATVKAHLDAVQQANQRAWATLNKMRNQILGRK